MKKGLKIFFAEITKWGASFFSGRQAARVGDVSLILILGLSISLLLTVFIGRLPRSIAVGSVATQDIKADQKYEIVDEKSTDKIREEEAISILPVYDFNPSMVDDTVDKIQGAFAFAREFLDQKKALEGRGGYLPEDQENQLKSEFLKNLEINLADSSFEMVRKFRFHPGIENAFVSLIRNAMSAPIIHDLGEMEVSEAKGFTLRRLDSEENFPEEAINDPSLIQDLEGARKKIASLGLKSLEGAMNLEFIGETDFTTLKEAALPFVKINTNYNGLETDERRKKARNNIKNIIIIIQAGESIIRNGDRFEPWHLTVINGILKEKQKTNRFLKFLGHFLFVNLFLIILYYFASKYIRKFHPNRKDLVFLGLNLILFLAVLRGGIFLGSSLRESFGAETLFYLIPVAGGAMLVRFILNSEVAFIFAVISSLFSGIFLENSLEMTVYYLIGGVFAAFSIAHAEKRSTVLVCGVQTGMVNALTIFSLNLISMSSLSSGNFQASQILVNMISGFLGGISTAMIVLAFSPVMEALFHYTTNIQLLELANLSHPLLKEMIVRAPGTYHHSQIVGILSEAAAEAIGANPLLARVGSYYHDIGKMKKPQYFIENQRGENPHDRLNPSMSALIIEAHVRDGIEMARDYKLPQKIADMIPQHQGTKLIGFFFNKAKKVNDPSLGRIEERDYRYPGPKPQTREAGIIMLADTIEAAVRALPEKSPGKIQGAVEKLVNQHFVDEQLDECELTLRDLHRMADAFVKILVGIYHQRVEYPEGALVANTEVHFLKKKQKTAYDGLSEQQAPLTSNVAPLFKKKDQDSSA